MNHKVNALVHKLPPCPECSAAYCKPCVGKRGENREPHNVRAALAAGELAVIPIGARALALAQRKVVAGALIASDGNVTRAAELLGTHRQTLQRKLRGGAAERKLKRAVDAACDTVRKEWGIKPMRRRG